MEPDYVPTDPREIDRAAARPDRRRSRRLIAVAAGTTIALGAGGVAYAASGTTPTPSDSAPAEVAPEDLPDGVRPHGGLMHAGAFGMVHGEMVVETDDGSYETVATQRGTIDEITEDSITVTSEDGYTATYVLDETALESDHPAMADPADLAAGDEVMVMAGVDGSTKTVRSLVDLANLPVWAGPGERAERFSGDKAPEAAPDTSAS